QHIPQLIEAFLDQHWILIQTTVQTLVAKVPDMIAAGHRDALLKHVADTSGARQEALQRFDWRIWEFEEDLVLGDSCAFAELLDGRFRALADLTPAVRRHLVPISHRRCLIGADTPLQPPARLVRDGAARCSFDCFCANADTTEGRRLQAFIGFDAMPLSAEE